VTQGFGNGREVPQGPVGSRG